MNYISDNTMSDAALLRRIGAFIRAQRIEQGQSQGELAEQAGLSRSTLSLLERGQVVSLSTLIQVLRVLDRLDVFDAFRDEPQVSPLAIARERRKKYQRVGRSGRNSPEESEW